MADAGKVVVVSGPSGVGKSTIVREVIARTGADFSVSVTTRKPRADEVDGREYHFVDRATFERMIDAGQLLEWAEVFGHYYGTPAGPVEEALADGRVILLDVDVQGARQVHRRMPDATFVLIVPPDQDALAARLRGRGSEGPEALAERFAKAQAEISAARDSGAYNHVIVNDELPEAVRSLVEVVRK